MFLTFYFKNQNRNVTGGTTRCKKNNMSQSGLLYKSTLATILILIMVLKDPESGDTEEVDQNQRTKLPEIFNGF